jgi:5-methyltetrahydrofolate--homocysteine methyltransferase
LSDFVAPAELGRYDSLGLFAVSSGFGLDAFCAKLEADHDEFSMIMAKALGDRLAEAMAELLHLKVRQQWGYGRQEQLEIADLIKERYRGIRPAPGYPACPDHRGKKVIWELLQVPAATGIELTESLAMWPASSVSGVYFAAPEARYFAVGKVGRDQIEDYAKRWNEPVETTERWLGPNLNYDPEPTPALR